MSQKVVVSAEQLASLFEHSRNAGTLTAWCAAAIQWAHDAEAQGIQLVSDIAAVKRERDELREALRRLYRGYVVTLENGRDRIITLGGDCDPVDRMEREDPLLHDMRALLSRIDGGGT
jgi:hypothetical protein